MTIKGEVTTQVAKKRKREQVKKTAYLTGHDRTGRISDTSY
jgi:hypothetical protein